MAKQLVVDSCILIDLERGSSEAAAYVPGVVRAGIGAIHPVTAAELLFGVRDREHQRKVRAMLSSFKVLNARNADLASAMAWVDELTLRARVGWPDCLIAATCIRLDLPLVTSNDRHFRVFKGLKVIRPY